MVRKSCALTLCRWPFGEAGPRLSVMNAEQIRERLPHAGAMCLLERVVRWDSSLIICETDGHRSPTHPLAGPDGLGSANAIEYAAQAMALHAGLLAVESASVAVETAAGAGRSAPGAAGHGVLASLRSVRLLEARLDQVRGSLSIEARLLLGDASAAQYEFTVRGDGRTLVSGRASVLFRLNNGR